MLHICFILSFMLSEITISQSPVQHPFYFPNRFHHQHSWIYIGDEMKPYENRFMALPGQCTWVIPWAM